jgi:hypothetical protein
MGLEIREKAGSEITRLKGETGLPLPLLPGFAGIPERTWREWEERRDVQTRQRHTARIHLTPGCG